MSTLTNPITVGAMTGAVVGGGYNLANGSKKQGALSRLKTGALTGGAIGAGIGGASFYGGSALNRRLRPQ